MLEFSHSEEESLLVQTASSYRAKWMDEQHRAYETAKCVSNDAVEAFDFFMNGDFMGKVVVRH